MPPLAIKIIFLIFFLAYLVYFIFSKNYIKTYIPFMGLGYLMGPFGFDLFSASMAEPSLLILYSALFLLGIQLGKGLGKKFWTNFPLESFFYQVGEKFLLIILFLIIFFMAVPSFVTVPVSFPFYLSIAAFSSSFFFIHFITNRFRVFISAYYEINNLIVMGLFIVFSIIFLPLRETGLSFPPHQKIAALVFPGVLMFFLFKTGIREKKILIPLWLSLILLGAACSKILGISPMITGFGAGIASNFMPLKKQLILKKFFLLFNDRIIVLFLMLSGLLLKVSLPLLLTAVLYLLVRILARILTSFFNFRGKIVRDFLQKSIFSLFQGEVFLGFLLYYAMEFHFYEILNVALISLIFSEFLINYYAYRFIGTEKKSHGG